MSGTAPGGGGPRVPARPGRAQFFDASNRRLVFLGQQATAEYWDEFWSGAAAPGRVAALPRRGTLVTRVTSRHLAPGSRILEGGCGTGVNARQLSRLGYRVVALDFAARTVARLGREAPQVDPVLGDVRALPFADASFDGYWSLGVIEHSYQGYGAIRDEMRRVVRPGGFLFLTFPYLNRLRLARARRGGYPAWDGSRREEFFQYALDHRRVVADFARAGFTLLEERPHLGLTGAQDLWPPLAGPFERLRRGPRAARGVGGALNALLEPFTAHLMLLVLRHDG